MNLIHIEEDIFLMLQSTGESEIKTRYHQSIIVSYGNKNNGLFILYIKLSFNLFRYLNKSEYKNTPEYLLKD